MQRLEAALDGLDQALTSPPRLQQPWRHIVHERLLAVLDELTAERTVAVDPWLHARAGHLHRERDGLTARLTVLATMIHDSTDLDAVRVALRRASLDIRHHHARVNDLAYDGLAMDVGGSD